MLPDAPLSARRRRTALLSGTVISCGIAVGALLAGPHPNLLSFFALASVVIGNVAIVVFAWPATDGLLVGVRRGCSHRGRNGGSPGLGLDAVAGPAPAMTRRQPVLRAVARLMPAEAGRRWLAEAESLLSELPAGRRGPAIRSYLYSAPRLLVLMWARRLRSRTGRRA
jgi:hypothetical protein